MQARPEQLAQQLSKQLAPCYLITGDETLITQECADAVRAAARAQGCTEREVIDISGVEDWQQLLHSGGAMSLFAERKLIELRLPSGKPGAEGSKALQAYLEFDSDDVLLIVSGKLDKNSQRAKWYTALDKAGVVVTVWPIRPHELPRWLGQRLEAAGLRADRDALHILAERVEGNLLAAAQEIEKLKLLAVDGRVTADTVLSDVLDNARYNSFGLADSAMAGDARAALRGLRGLEAEGNAAPAVLWALARDVALLAQISADQRRGMPLTQAIDRRGVWKNRINLVQSALSRHNEASIRSLQQLAFRVDASIKGLERDNPWRVLEQLVLLMAQGHQSASSRSRR